MCIVKFGVIVSPAVVVLPADFSGLEHRRSLPPDAEHFVKFSGVLALGGVNTQTDFPLRFIDGKAIDVLQGEQGVHQADGGINVQHSQGLWGNIQGAGQRGGQVCLGCPGAGFVL